MGVNIITVVSSHYKMSIWESADWRNAFIRALLKTIYFKFTSFLWVVGFVSLCIDWISLASLVVAEPRYNVCWIFKSTATWFYLLTFCIRIHLEFRTFFYKSLEQGRILNRTEEFPFISSISWIFSFVVNQSAGKREMTQKPSQRSDYFNSSLNLKTNV